MPAILLGSISTVADTSELQREAFNQAFAEHGLDWRWDRDDYLSMLESSGGQQRIADYAQARGQSVDSAAIHQTKSTVFQKNVGAAGLSLRPGVGDTVRDAKRDGMKVGLVTTTSQENVHALLAALRPELDSADFDVIVTSENVAGSKPDPAAYTYALEQLDEAPQDCVAVEDNLGGVRAAQAADIPCVAFPNQNTAGHDFSAADLTVDKLDLDDLKQLLSN